MPPVPEPPPFRLSVPLVTLTVPLLLNATLTVVVPLTADDLVNVPLLKIAGIAPPL